MTDLIGERLSHAGRLRRRDILKGAAGLTVAALVAPSVGWAQAGKRLLVGVHQDLPIPDAQMSRAMVTHMVMKHVVENLVTFDENYEVIPQLAKSWDVLDDGARYVFHLRDNVVFHNGKTLDADDVKWSVDRLKEVSPSKGSYSGIKAVNVIDPRTVEIVLKDPSPSLPSTLAGPFGGYIMPKDLDKAQGGTISKPIGTGPFSWVEYQPGRLLRVKKFDNYSVDTSFDGPTGLGGRREAQVDEIEFRVVPVSSARATALETGELDFALLLDVNDFERLAASRTARQVEEPSFESLVLWLGVTVAPTSDLNFRKAVAASIDYKTLMDASVAGHGAVNNAFLHPELRAWFTPSMAARHKFDLNTAKALLAKTAYRGETLTIHVSNSTEYSLNAALVLQQMLGQAGIKIEVHPVDSAGVMSIVYARKPTYNFGMTSISGRMDPDQVYFQRLHSSSAVNAYNNPEYDKVVEAARASMSQETRRKLYSQAQDIVMADIPAIVLFNVSFLNARAPRMVGYKPNALGLSRFWNVGLGK
ncbi:ABC transporter substrate-binding protein [Xanthobacter tagetidis]|nr:ABC transporter substrate-binding protein [Xanthobacter tagetidis]MBB6309084.1 peptide/nickel transport system substrate-binding protein [Xanthobacter tagetidis]